MKNGFSLRKRMLERFSVSIDDEPRNRFCALMVMMVNGFEVEILEEGGDQISMESQLMQLSLYSFLGMNSPTTMKVRGRVGNTSMVIITHNFVSPVFTKKAHLTKKVFCMPDGLPPVRGIEHQIV